MSLPREEPDPDPHSVIEIHLILNFRDLRFTCESSVTESIFNQDTLDNANYLSRKKDIVKRGRKERLSVDKFLDVVKRKKSLEDSVIAEFIGMRARRGGIWVKVASDIKCFQFIRSPIMG